MFNVSLFLLLVLISVPGILVVLPRTMRLLRPTIAANLKPGQSMPSQRQLVLISVAQSTVLIAVASAIGTVLAPRAGLSAPFFEAVANGAWSDVSTAAQGQLLPALGLSVAGVALFMLAYYGLFRPKMDATSVAVAENMRRELGLAGRVLYGGIYEEVLTRWGLMTAFVWLFAFLLEGPIAVWLAIVLSGVLFGLGHLPGSFAAGVRRTPWTIATAIFLNLWASLIFGWLFWQVGLLAAMLAHMLFHLLWYPVEQRAGQVDVQSVVG